MIERTDYNDYSQEVRLNHQNKKEVDTLKNFEDSCKSLSGDTRTEFIRQYNLRVDTINEIAKVMAENTKKQPPIAHKLLITIKGKLHPAWLISTKFTKIRIYDTYLLPDGRLATTIGGNHSGECFIDLPYIKTIDENSFMIEAKRIEAVLHSLIKQAPAFNVSESEISRLSGELCSLL